MTAFDRRTGMLWLDGATVEWQAARIHVLTHGHHYASSVFEGIRVYEGKPFALTDHVARPPASAAILGFEVPVNDECLTRGRRRSPP